MALLDAICTHAHKYALLVEYASEKISHGNGYTAMSTLRRGKAFGWFYARSHQEIRLSWFV